MKRVVLVSNSDSRGGAAVVTYRLMEALCGAGLDARMLVMHRGHTDDPRVAQIGPAWRRKAVFLAEHAEIWLRTGFDRADVFKMSTARYGMAVHSHPWVRQADAVVLGWVNQGMISLAEVGRIATRKPLAWVMHDMWQLTGVCHHAGTCNHFMAPDGRCGNCPLICNGRRADDLSASTWRRKNRLYAQTPIKFVAVSNWLAQKCRQSTLMADADVSVLPNPFPIADFSPLISNPSPLIVIGAARLDDPIKNLPLAVETLNRVTHPGANALFYGELRDPAALDGLRMPHQYVGMVHGRQNLAQIYAQAAVVLSTSHYETLPGTLVEGMASGAMAVCTGNGGQADIVDHGITGFIAPEPSPTLLAGYIDQALANPTDRQAQHRAMAAKFDSAVVAQKYIELLNL